MATFLKAPPEVNEFVQDVMRQYHPNLFGLEVSTQCVMALADTDEDGDPKGPAIKCHGFPAAATVRITSPKARCHGHAMVELTIDEQRWEELTEAQRTALIDHELTHLEVAKENGGKDIAYDKSGNVRLKIRQHDWQIGGFESVIQKHGKDALEAMSVMEVVIPEAKAARQLVFDFFHGAAEPELAAA
jgi:hypothetical protein